MIENKQPKFLNFLIKYKNQIILGLIILIAIFFRFYKITNIPPGLYPDEAVNGTDALNALENNEFKIFYPNNNGREGLFINLIAIGFKIFGPNIWTIRLTSAIFGVLTVWGLYLLTKIIFSKRVALFSSFLLATSFWHINFSRIGFRAIMVPFFIIFGFYFLFLAFNSKKIWHYILSGVFLGLGFYTYIAFRFVFLILLFIIGIKFIEQLKKIKLENHDFNFWWQIFYKKNDWWKIDILFLVIILTALPIGIYFIQNPQDFFGRSTQVSIFSQQNVLLSLGKSIVLTLGMFNFYGDANWRHNYSTLPQLLWPVGILFLIGIILAIKKIILVYKNKKEIILSYSFLIFGFLVMLLPSILTYEGLPHALRAIGSIPFVFIFSGIGFNFVYKKLKAINLKYLNFILILFFIFVGFSEFNKYFLKWANRPEVSDAFSQNLVNIGQYLNTEQSNIRKYIIINMGGVLVDDLPMPSQTIKFITYNQKNIIYLKPENLDNFLFLKNDQIIPISDDINIFEKLKLKYPKGNIIKKDKFSIFIVN